MIPSYRRLSGPAYTGAFVEHYDELRPRPPQRLIELVGSLSPNKPPQLVVDLGCGTGISTQPWAGRARRVIGIDVNAEMLERASKRPNVEYRHGTADSTGLPDGCADVVTCGQSFHWMDAEPTIAEIARLLRPAGVFAAYDYDWPPVITPEVDAQFLRVIEASGIDPARPEKAIHLERLKRSGLFADVHECALQGWEMVSADHVAQLPLAFGPIVRRLDEGVTADELGLTRLRDIVERRLNPETNAVVWRYRVRIARKQ